jgi:L-amino acid N-acyltransferase YncA
MDFRVRPARVEDAASIGRVHVESWRSTYAGIVPAAYLASLDVAVRTAAWAERLVRGHMLVFVAEDAAGVFGFVSGGPAREGLEGYDSELYAIYLLQSQQKRGAGKALMLKLAAELRARGSHSLALWVLRDNPTVGFYKHMGGVEIEQKTIELGGMPLIEIALGWPQIEELKSNQ